MVEMTDWIGYERLNRVVERIGWEGRGKVREDKRMEDG